MLDSKIFLLIEDQNKLGGIDISKLKLGTNLLIYTKNSEYDITVLGERKILLKGGKYFKEFTECYLNGSTWGTSMLKLHWIGYEMLMEIVTSDNKIIRSSPVKRAIITYGNDWTYEIKWENGF